MNTNSKIMRLLYIIILILFKVNLICGQASIKGIDLNNGKYDVGFQHYTTSDSTRTYSRVYDYSNQIIARPIPVSIWYPSNQNSNSNEQLKVLDYLEILKEEEEWEYLPNEQILNWFYYSNTSANQDHFKEKTTAYSELEFANIYKTSVEGGSPVRFTNYEGYDGAPSISSDLSKLVFESYGGDPDDSDGTSIWIMETQN